MPFCQISCLKFIFIHSMKFITLKVSMGYRSHIFWHLKHRKSGVKIRFSRFSDLTINKQNWPEYSPLNWNKFILKLSWWSKSEKFSSTIVKKWVIRVNCYKLIWSFLDGSIVKISSTMVSAFMRSWNITWVQCVMVITIFHI